jgi:L-serine dehydratase
MSGTIMALSVFDMFKIGIGPSSSHTVGPMRAALEFAHGLEKDGLLTKVQRIEAELYGSLGATGKGHGSDTAVLLGLSGEAPDTVDPHSVSGKLSRIRDDKQLSLLGKHDITFEEKKHLIFYTETLPYHPNGMRFIAYDAAGSALRSKVYYSVGGGFVVNEEAIGAERVKADETPVKYPFHSADELMAICNQHKLSISQLMMENEKAWRSEEKTREGLLKIWAVMQECVNNGMKNRGILPGGLNVKRRAAELHDQLEQEAKTKRLQHDPLTVMDWVNVYALAVNEENAAGGRVVTAPTNGAAGIIPAVMHYAHHFCNATPAQMVDFLLAAAAIGIIIKENASISGADVGCQGEVGSACAMAAGGLAEILGGTVEQVENAAEIGMEHNLGLTCDPIAGLVQVPCIERNAMAAVKAINATRISMRGDGKHFVSLDKAVKTMRDTGADMLDKYKETARGGLAVNVIEC